jgi:hypothetical protein
VCPDNLKKKSPVQSPPFFQDFTRLLFIIHPVPRREEITVCGSRAPSRTGKIQKNPDRPKPGGWFFLQDNRDQNV